MNEIEEDVEFQQVLEALKAKVKEQPEREEEIAMGLINCMAECIGLLPEDEQEAMLAELEQAGVSVHNTESLA